MAKPSGAAPQRCRKCHRQAVQGSEHRPAGDSAKPEVPAAPAHSANARWHRASRLLLNEGRGLNPGDSPHRIGKVQNLWSIPRVRGKRELTNERTMV